MKPIRLLAVVLLSAVVFVGFAAGASAQTATCSATQLNPGDVLTVTGSGEPPGATATLLFGGSAIGASTVGGSGFFSVSGTIPTDATPGTYQIQVNFTDPETGLPVAEPLFPCTVTVVPAQATAPPTAVPTAAPTAAPVATPNFVFVPIAGISPIVQQQQQQQGGGGLAPQVQPRPGPGQQQFVPAPRFIPTGGGVSLPKTGSEIARTAGIGSALLLFGLVLVLFARRRRRIARERALAELPPIEAVVVEPEIPWLPGTAHPSEFLTEADSVLPADVEPEQLYLPAPKEADDDILTPSF